MPREVESANEAFFDDVLGGLPAVANEQPQSYSSSYSANGHRLPFDMPAFIARYGLRVNSIKQDGGGTKYMLEQCPFDPSHTAPDSYVALMTSGAQCFYCSHNSCASYKWQDLREKLEPGYKNKKPDWDAKSKEHHGFDQAKAGETTKPAVAYERITAAELNAATYKLEYLIDGVLVGAQPQIVAGGKKCLKTNLLCDAVISLATGLSFLGSFRVKRKVRTAFMSGESGLHTIQETCRRICRAKQIELGDVDGLVFSPDLPRIDDPRHQAALEQFITADGGIEAIVLDPAYLCLPGGDAGNLFIQGEMLRNLSAICQAQGATLILCHHTKRGGIADPFEPPELEHIAWAGFQEFARGWWLIGRRMRYEPGTGLHRLWLSIGGSAGHSSLWGLDINEGVYEPGKSSRVWEVEVISVGDAREGARKQAASSKEAKIQNQLNHDVKALLEVAAKYPEGETKNVLKTAAGLNGSRADLAIASALKSGRLVQCSVLKASRRTPYDALKLNQKPDQSDQSD